MKKILLVLLLAGISLAQTNIYAPDNSATLLWSDSLWNDIYVDTSATPDDTTAASTTASVKLGGEYDWLYLTAVDTGATYDDSVVVEHLIIYPDAHWGDRDSIWQKVHFMRDSSWTNVNLICNDDSYTSYTIDVGGYEAVRVRMVNATTVENLIWRFYAILSRKK